MHITEMSRATGASVDELRYMETKGFLDVTKAQLKRRQVREYQKSDVRRVQIVIKYRRQGFTWDTALKRAEQELNNPSLFDNV